MKSNIVNITIIGSSIGLRIKPAEEDRSYNLNYSALIEKELNLLSKDNYRVHNLSFTRAMIYEFLKMKDQIVQTNPNIIIFNLGAVEAPNRDVPRWVSDIVFGRSWQFFRPIFLLYYFGFWGRFFRKHLVYLRGKKPWISKERFNRELEELFDFIKQSTSADMIVLDVNAKSVKIEKALPGSLKNYIWYSNRLKDFAIEKKLNFISLSDLDPDCHYPDGVHFNRRGHEIVAERLISTILSK